MKGSIGEVDLAALLELVDYLRHGRARTRVGLWCAPPEAVGKETEIAVRLGAEPLDVSSYYLDHLPPGAKFARLSAAKVIETLDSIASATGRCDCVLVFNLDLLLAGLTADTRQEVWGYLFNGLPNRLRPLIIMLPGSASELMPDEDQLGKWREEGRLIQ